MSDEVSPIGKKPILPKNNEEKNCKLKILSLDVATVAKKTFQTKRSFPEKSLKDRDISIKHKKDALTSKIERANQ